MFCAISKGGFFDIAFVRRRRHTFASLWGACLRFASLWSANWRGDSCVLGVHLSNVCWGLLFCLRKSFIFSALNFRKAYIIKSLLKVCYRSVFNESSKALIFQKCAESFTHWVKFYFGWNLHIFLWKMRATPGACIKPGCLALRLLCHRVNLLSCVARQP